MLGTWIDPVTAQLMMTAPVCLDILSSCLETGRNPTASRVHIIDVKSSQTRNERSQFDCVANGRLLILLFIGDTSGLSKGNVEPRRTLATEEQKRLDNSVPGVENSNPDP